MSNETAATEHSPETGIPGPGFVPPAQPATGPAAYGAQPVQPAGPASPEAGQAPPAYAGQPVPAPAAYGQPPAQPGEQEQHWTSEGLVSTPVLPPERVGHGALLALVAIPVGVVLSALIWKLGFVASLSGVVVAAGASVLYARGSGGRIKKGIPVIALIVAVGIAGSFFAAVAVDLYDVFPQLDPEISSSYAGRGAFVADNLFYGPVLKEYSRTIFLFVLFGVLGGFGTIVRLLRMNASL
ncbi:hypothetical protein GCM10022197_18160 [Microlunatus spumicola]|uniref:Uncharacterized protein n=1 Tax=Microlunatus spumicola TaxID=81499 RepID=A0ABP6X854_9ACTN